MSLGKGLFENNKERKLNSKEKLELYKNVYFHELEVREQIINRLNLPPLIFTTLITVYGFILTKTSLLDIGLAHFFVYSVLIVSVAFFIGSCRDFYWALTGHEYSKIISLQEIEGYSKTLENTHGDESYAEWREKELDDYMLDSYVQCSSNNERKNDARSLKISHMYKKLKWCVLFLGACYPVFVFSPVYDGSSKVVVEKINNHSGEYSVRVAGELNSNSVTIKLSKEIEEMLNDRQKRQ